MRKRTFWPVAACILLSVVLVQSCRDDSYLATAPPVPDQSLTEEFDSVASTLARGWNFKNVSEPKGSNIWQQGGAIAPWFEPYSSNGTYAGFIGAEYTSTSADKGVISNWVISPVVTFQNGDKITFYTRTYLSLALMGDSTDYANRLQLRINTNNESLNVGSGLSTGDFSTSLVDINPTYEEYHSTPALYSATAYPARWTRFEGTVTGLNNPTKGRFAFRYFVEEAGSNGRATGVALDKVQYLSISKK